MSDDESKRATQAGVIPKAQLAAADEFHMWMGMCIALWATVETRIFRICWKSLACSEERAAIVYFKSPSLEARMTLTQELVESVLPKTTTGQPIHDDLKAWNEIVGAFNRLKQIRNRIAHHPVSSRMATTSGDFGREPYGSKPFGSTTIDYWFENYVSPEEHLRGRHDQTLPLGLDDLKKHHRSTFDLTNMLDEFLENHLPAYL